MIRLPTRKRRKKNGERERGEEGGRGREERSMRREGEGERRGVRGGREREKREECKEGERGKAERR